MFVMTPQTRIIALDLETTGLSARRDRIVEMAAVCWQPGGETGHFQTLVNPGCPIPARVTRIHGITDAMVSDKPSARDVLPAFLEFCRADLVVAHNSPFDVRFLRAECEYLGLPFFTTPVLDTCSLARERLPGCPNYRLETLKAALDMGYGQAHRALEDARDCLALFLHCLRTDAPALRLPVDPPPLPEKLRALCSALKSGSTVIIEYRDARGHITQREIRPMHIDRATVEAFCLLRNEARHFSLERIERILP
jgi:DNA polymerase-3 subunit epsilon